MHAVGSEDSDLEVEADPPDWQSLLTEEELSRLQPLEKKRQDVINGEFIIFSFVFLLLLLVVIN